MATGVKIVTHNAKRDICTVEVMKRYKAMNMLALLIAKYDTYYRPAQCNKFKLGYIIFISHQVQTSVRVTD